MPSLKPSLSPRPRPAHAPPLALRLPDPPGMPLDRARIERFIRERFADRHGARVTRFMPCLLQLVDAEGAIQAAIGARSAADGPLFLERYLDRPAEIEIGRLLGAAPPRERIAEIGNLAALGPGRARLLIIALAELLAAEGYDWVAFTGTREVLNSFRRLGLAPLPLCPADPARMGEELSEWGRYYGSGPLVMAGDIRSGLARLADRGIHPSTPLPPRPLLRSPP